MQLNSHINVFKAVVRFLKMSSILFVSFLCKMTDKVLVCQTLCFDALCIFCRMPTDAIFKISKSLLCNERHKKQIPSFVSGSLSSTFNTFCYRHLMAAVAELDQSVKRPELRSLKEVQLSLREFDS